MESTAAVGGVQPHEAAPTSIPLVVQSEHEEGELMHDNDCLCAQQNKPASSPADENQSPKPAGPWNHEPREVPNQEKNSPPDGDLEEGAKRQLRTRLFGHILGSGALYGRQDEKEALLKSWERCCKDKTQEIVVISGSPGTGKSALADSLRPSINREKPRAFFLSGKFAESSHHRKGPFEVFVASFTRYTHQLLDSGDDELIARVRRSVQEAAKNDQQILVQMIPAFEQLFESSSSSIVATSADELSGFKSQLVGSEMANRLRNSFSKIVAALTSCTPILLLLDDLQWSDSSSLDILQSLIQCEHSMPLLVVATIRTKAPNTSSHAATMEPQQGFVSSELSSRPLEHKRFYRSTLKEFEEDESVRATRVDLSNLLVEHTQLLIADVLKRDPEDVLELSRIAHSQTHGNVFHLLQFLHLLVEESIVKYDGSWWVWDDARLLSEIGSVDSILGLVVRSIEKLPRSVQEALKVASCLGDEVDSSALELVLRAPADPLLQQASEEGLLVFSSKYGGYRFSHDWIRHAAFDLIPKDDVQEFHLKIGRRLLQNASSSALDSNVMVIVSLLNAGGEFITESRERYKVAELSLQAGLKALKLPSLPDAARFFRHGTSFLGSDCWQNHYKLSLDLYSYAAEIETANGNSDIALPYINEVVQHGACLDDKIKTYLALLDSMNQQGDLREATAVCVDVLSKLGERLPSRASKLTAGKEFFNARLQLRGKKNEDILNGPIMTDPRKIEIMEFLTAGFILGWRTKDPMSAVFALRSVKLSMKFGIHETSAVGFAVYGATICGLHIDAKEGYRFGKVAMALCQKLNASPKVITVAHNVVGGGILHWSKPVAEDFETLDYVGRIGFEAGYIYNACTSMMIGNFYRHDTGFPLKELKKKVKYTLKLSRLYRLDSLQRGGALTLQMIHCYEGRTEDPTRLTGAVVDYDSSLQSCLVLKDKTLLLMHYSYAMELAFIHGDIVGAGGWGQACMRQLKGSPSPTFAASTMEIFNALIAVAVYRTGKSRTGKQHIKVARKHARRVKQWAKDAPDNFQHWCLLIQAELLGLKRRRKKDVICSLYANAFSFASKQNNLLCMALVKEKHGDFLSSRQDKDAALVQWNSSADLYSEWGAVVKSESLLSLVIQEQRSK